MVWYDYGRVTIEHDLEGLVFVTISLLSHFPLGQSVTNLINFPPPQKKLRTVSSFHPSCSSSRWAFSSHCAIPVIDSYPFLHILSLPIHPYPPTSLICSKHCYFMYIVCIEFTLNNPPVCIS